MNPSFRRLREVISAPRLLLHLLVLATMRQRETMQADMRRWAEILHLGTPRSAWDFAALFVTLMTFTPEFRNVFYMRVGPVSWLLRPICPPLATLSIVARSVGPGLFVQHGENTFVFADRIGDNFWIGRHVVVGFSNDTDHPTIGNNVKIFAGAKIVGKLRIGDNATIGLNTVILDNVEPNTTMLGVPGRVVWRTKPDESPA